MPFEIRSIMKRTVYRLCIVIAAVMAVTPAARADDGTHASLEALVRQAILASEGPHDESAGHLSVEFFSLPPRKIDEIGRVRFERRTGRFRVNALYRDAQGIVRRHAVLGRAVRQILVPVPVRRIEPGEMIAAADIEMVRLNLADLPPQSLTSEDDALGHEARRVLMPGRPLQARMLRPPRLVARNRLVRMIFAKGGLRIEIQGKALEDGGRREVVRVANLESGRVVQAVVTGPDTVSLIGNGGHP